ncbi:unnamed protein product [Cuscuta europaea]|uniref:Uncharacterized protein n=1 Tax=Cuscuta europaea TaxID=41803 RepID=A0A9P0YWT2_CUSEU|nr:unnamed protein product [Cuscuta europaea]
MHELGEDMRWVYYLTLIDLMRQKSHSHPSPPLCSSLSSRKEGEDSATPLFHSQTRAQPLEVQKEVFEEEKDRKKCGELKSITKVFLEFVGVSPEFHRSSPEFRRSSTEKRRIR